MSNHPDGMKSHSKSMRATPRREPRRPQSDSSTRGHWLPLCREVRDRYGAAVPIIFVSGERMDAVDRTAGLLLGADDYLVKPVDPGELIARIRRLVKPPQSNGHATFNGLDSLTKREHEVLDLLAQGHPQDEIARDLVISPKTVSTHIQRILGKLEVRSRAQAVSVALRHD
jgi:DNA-binding NarL/FixJ family response regulator